MTKILTDFDVAKIIGAVVTLRGLGSGPSGARAEALATLAQFHLTEEKAQRIAKRRRRRDTAGDARRRR